MNTFVDTHFNEEPQGFWSIIVSTKGDNILVNAPPPLLLLGNRVGCPGSPGLVSHSEVYDG